MIVERMGLLALPELAHSLYMHWPSVLFLFWQIYEMFDVFMSDK